MPRRNTRKPAESAAPKQPAAIPGQNEAPATSAPKVDLDEAMPAAMENTPAEVASVESKVDAAATAAAADPVATKRGTDRIRGWGKGNSEWEMGKFLDAAAKGLDEATGTYEVPRRSYQDSRTLNNVIGRMAEQGIAATPINLPLSEGKKPYQLLHGGLVMDDKGVPRRALTLDETAQFAVGGIGKMDPGNAAYASKEQVIEAALGQIIPQELSSFRSIAAAADPAFADLDDRSAGMALLEAKLGALNKTGQQLYARGNNDSLLLLRGMKLNLDAKKPEFDAFLERETGIPGFADRLRAEVVKEQQAGGDGSGVLQQAMDWLQKVNPTPYGEGTPDALKNMANWKHLAGWSGVTAGGLAAASAMAGGSGGDDDQYLALLAAQNASRPAY